MASTGKCPFCGGAVLSNEKTCPHCGGENPLYTEDSLRRIFQPKTIEELREYCAERGMPLLRMRFFVGEDYREPKAFGIFKAGENRYIVYKNKADGSRAVRYDGPDEAYAVKELFDKLLSECHNRGIYPDGVVQRSSGSTATGAKRRKQPAPLIIIGFFLLCILVPLASKWIDEQNQINKKIADLRQRPYTYDSVYIGNKYYTFDLNSREVVASSSNNSHLNDGYYLGTYYVFPSDNGEYTSAASGFKARDGQAQHGAVYYRDGEDIWYVFITAEEDWKPAEEPGYSRLGDSLDYQGSDWQTSWNVPDFTSFPVESGYYGYKADCYFRESRRNSGSWYVYSKEDSDWRSSDCPVKLGIPVSDLEFLGSDYRDNMKTGIKDFKESTAYAISHQLSGYYLQGDRFFYQYALASDTKSKKWWEIPRYTYYWGTYGQKQDNENPSEQVQAGENTNEWYQISEAPDPASLVFLGSSYHSDWQEKGPVADFKESALGMQVYSINGYVKQEKNLYYHYKSSWYQFNSDSSAWEKSSGPSDDGLSEIYLGDSYRAGNADEWEDDWQTTDFKTSSTWKSIVAAEAAEAQRIAREAEEKQAEAERHNNWYSSDYDDWDIGDTDWDSDW